MATLNYIGSKKSLLDFLDTIISKLNDKYENPQKIKFLDGFAGTGIVGKYFNQKYKYILYANDLEYYSWLINYAQLKVEYTDKLNDLINELNLVQKTNNKKFNLIAENYSEKGKEKRMFWTINNAEKADAIIEKIKAKLDSEDITNDEYIFLMASLITSFDKVANTTSVYGAFLKQYKSAAQHNYEFKPIHMNKKIKHHKKNKVFNSDVNSNSVLDREYDIVYLDPPYNNRQYSTNYHPLNYIAKYDETIIPYGKTGLLENANKSDFSVGKKVYDAFSNLINNLDTSYIFISYNDEGLLNKDDLKEILTKKGKVTLYKYEYKKFKSSSKQENETVYEYLYLCEVGKKGKYSEKKFEKD
jgi:adenine-specific DNA-methyltransferase